MLSWSFDPCYYHFPEQAYSWPVGLRDAGPRDMEEVVQVDQLDADKRDRRCRNPREGLKRVGSGGEGGSRDRKTGDLEGYDGLRRPSFARPTL